MMKTFHETVNTDAPTHILVEEEKSIREEWLRIANEKNLFLMTYPDPEWFLNDLRLGVFRSQDRFYLDQDFGEVRGVGLRLSGVIKARWPDAYTCLVTGYPRFMFYRELRKGAVNDVFGKYPAPFKNPRFMTFEEEYERDVWVPLTGTFQGCNG